MSSAQFGFPEWQKAARTSALDIIVRIGDGRGMRYPGGKGKCYQQIINLMPPHRVYIESHLGGGAVLRHKRPAEHNMGVDIDSDVIARWRSEGFEGCEIIHQDAFTHLASLSYKGDELIYADPPYVASTRRRQKVYRFDYSQKEHEQLLSLLKQVPCMVMISGYDNEMYNVALSRWRKVTFNAKTHVDTRKECIWLNFPCTPKLHDARYLGSSFRERQTVKRRLDRMQDRIRRMRPLERHELIRWMNTAYPLENGES